MDLHHLTTHLQSLTGAHATHDIPIETIESITGPLPAAAWTDVSWWTNSVTQPQGQAWLAAGWEVSRVDVPGQVVSFRRTD